MQIVHSVNRFEIWVESKTAKGSVFHAVKTRFRDVALDAL